jgi:hypothetical protein
MEWGEIFESVAATASIASLAGDIILTSKVIRLTRRPKCSGRPLTMANLARSHTLSRGTYSLASKACVALIRPG